MKSNYWKTTWRIYEREKYIGIWPNEGIGKSSGYAPMAKVVGDARWVDEKKRLEIAELMASAPDLKKDNERLREALRKISLLPCEWTVHEIAVEALKKEIWE
jgi:hypothetical protein